VATGVKGDLRLVVAMLAIFIFGFLLLFLFYIFFFLSSVYY